MKHYLVYQITNLINGMIYIGKHVTDDPNDSYMGSSKWLAKSIKKHGIEHYRKDILFDFNNEAEMNAKEHELVNDVFVERSDTYNLNVGGAGSWYACNSNGMNNKNKQYRIAGEKCKSDPQYREQFGAKVSAGIHLNAKTGSWTVSKQFVLVQVATYRFIPTGLRALQVKWITAM